MRKVILYVAMSLDGYLADEQGGLDWILEAGAVEQAESAEKADGETREHTPSRYEQFYDTVDTVVMGRVTYEQISREISPDVWMYGGKKTYVLTKTAQNPLPDIEFTQREPGELIRYLKHRKGKDIWICGGARLISAMMTANLIDEYRISLVPVVLGKGIALFSPQEQGVKLQLQDCVPENGMVDLVYRPKPGNEKNNL